MENIKIPEGWESVAPGTILEEGMRHYTNWKESWGSDTPGFTNWVACAGMPWDGTGAPCIRRKVAKPIDWSKPLQTVDGRKARLIGRVDSSFPHVVAIEGYFRSHSEQIVQYSDSAASKLGIKVVSGTALVMATEPGLDALCNPPQKIKRTFWLNLYPQGDPVVHCSREAADASASGNRVACQSVTVEYEQPSPA